jgi:hypothetical protein
LPLHTEKAIYAFSGCFRNVNENTAALMIDHCGKLADKS